jgi:hypothetical protein
MRGCVPFVAALLSVAAACGPTNPRHAERMETPESAPGQLETSDALFRPTYGKPEIQRALITERGAEATDEKVVAELMAKEGHDERLRFAQADLAVRRRFIASLEVCEDSGRACPPRLDDPAWAYDPDPDRPTPPPLDAPLRYDLASWQKVATELHGRACACRNQACVDSMQVTIDDLERKPMPDVQGDDVATQSITWARECLFRLRGKTAMPKKLDLTAE